jgi:predicted deacetylase
MRARYIFRLDDVCENMNWDNYYLVRSIFLDNDIRPIIGVIPENKDETLLKYPRCNFNFWDEIYWLQNSKGWSVALHGYNHVYVSKDSGLLGINNKSEFAGLSKEQQESKIKKGLEIFNDKKIRIDAFMAPAHSFDKITIECLKNNGINVVTDGYSLYPYYEDGILFVPQLFSRPRRMPFGIYTWCLHTNTMSEESIKELDKFIKLNRDNVISFYEAPKYIIEYKSYRIQHWILKSIIRSIRKLRRN